MQHTAWNFAAIYLGLNALLTLLLVLEKMTLFDALCHAFGTMATGGFSTYNASVAHFDSEMVDYTITLFMIIAGMNFTLIYLVLNRPLGNHVSRYRVADLRRRDRHGVAGDAGHVARPLP